MLMALLLRDAVLGSGRDLVHVGTEMKEVGRRHAAH